MSAAAGTELAVPRVIVVGPLQLHAELSAYPGEWDAQQPVPDTAGLWSAFASSSVDPASPYIVFSAATASPAQISGAIIAMLSSAKPFVIVPDVSSIATYQGAVASAASSAGVDAGQVSWATRSSDLIAMLRGELARANEAALLAATAAALEPLETSAPDSTVSSAPSLDLPFVDDGSAPPLVPDVAPFSPSTSAYGTLVDDSSNLVGEQDAYSARYDPPSFYYTPEQQAAPAPAAVPPLAPVSNISGPHDTVIGSPAAAHLPTLSVVPDAAATPLAKTVPAPAKLPGQMTIAVTSSKGGSGKSTTALMLATTIAQSSKAAGRPVRVALVDLDARDGQVSTLIGTYLPTAFNLWSAPVWDERTISAAMVPAADLGIDCLLAPARPRASGGIGTEFYRHIIQMLQGMYDVVVLDTAANYLEPATWEVALREANSILLVTTLANTAIQGMSRAVRDITDPVDVGGLGIPREHLSIVVNQSVAGVGIDMEFIVQAALHVPIVAAVPMATRDVLLATNHSAMQALLKHPYLGPAYFGLARAVLPHVVLVPLVATSAESQRAASGSAQNARKTVGDTSAQETRTTPSDGIQSEQTPSNGSAVDAASVESMSSVLGS